MEKLGVQLDDTKTKTAGKDLKTCPKCGGPLQTVEGGSMPWCPKCGTEPFEKQK